MLDQLEQTIAEARADGQHGTAVAALALSAKLVGLLRDRIEGGNGDGFDASGTMDEIVNRLLDRMTIDEALSLHEQLRADLIRVATDRARQIA